jgi:predicted transcriptional regulator
LTTVQQMMERLRKKGALVREPSLRGLIYRATVTSEELMGGAVRDFVDRSLEGSLAPFAMYLAERGHTLPDHEIAELRRIIDRLSEERDA